MKNDNNRKITQYLLILTVTPFFVGLFIGLVILGWWLWPIEFVDTEPNVLRSDYQATYITLVADSYSLNNDIELARLRLASWQDVELNLAMNEAITAESNLGHTQQVNNIRHLMTDLSISEQQPENAISQLLPRTTLGGISMYACISFIVGIIFAALSVGALDLFVKTASKYEK